MASQVDVINSEIMNDTLGNIVNILKAIDQSTSLQHVTSGNTRRKSNLLRRLLEELTDDSSNVAIAIMKLFELIGNLFDQSYK